MKIQNYEQKNQAEKLLAKVKSAHALAVWECASLRKQKMELECAILNFTLENKNSVKKI